MPGKEEIVENTSRFSGETLFSPSYNLSNKTLCSRLGFMLILGKEAVGIYMMDHHFQGDIVITNDHQCYLENG